MNLNFSHLPFYFQKHRQITGCLRTRTQPRWPFCWHLVRSLLSRWTLGPTASVLLPVVKYLCAPLPRLFQTALLRCCWHSRGWKETRVWGAGGWMGGSVPGREHGPTSRPSWRCGDGECALCSVCGGVHRAGPGLCVCTWAPPPMGRTAARPADACLELSLFSVVVPLLSPSASSFPSSLASLFLPLLHSLTLWDGTATQQAVLYPLSLRAESLLYLMCWAYLASQWSHARERMRHSRLSWVKHAWNLEFELCCSLPEHSLR